MQTTTRNASLEDLAAILTAQQFSKQDVVASASAIRSVNGNLVIKNAGEALPDPVEGVKYTDGVFTPTKVADEGLAEKLGVPLPYLRKLRAERIDLFDANVNGWLQGHVLPDLLGQEGIAHGDRDPRSFLVRCFKGDGGNGIARAILSDTYKTIDHLDVLTAALQGIQESGAEIKVLAADLSDRKMYVKIAAPGISVLAPTLLENYRNPHDGSQPHWGFAAAAREGHGYEPGKEPIIFAGFILSNSETGDGAFTLVPRLVVEICGNGLQIPVDAVRAIHLGGKLDEGVINWSEETQERQLGLITSKAKDAVKTFLDVEYIRKTVGVLEAKAGAPINDPIETVTAVAKKLAFSQETTKGVLDHFIKAGQLTSGGVMQAVTSYAQHVEDADASADLESQAIKALELAYAAA